MTKQISKATFIRKEKENISYSNSAHHSLSHTMCKAMAIGAVRDLKMSKIYYYLETQKSCSDLSSNQALHVPFNKYSGTQKSLSNLSFQQSLSGFSRKTKGSCQNPISRLVAKWFPSPMPSMTIERLIIT